MTNKLDVLDKNGNVTGLAQRMVYKIQANGRILHAHHGANPDGVHGVATRPSSDNSNECEFSIHAVPGKSKFYYIVTKGKMLSIAHGNSDNAKERNGNWHEILGRGKNSDSEWHKTGPESQWQFEQLSTGFFRISTTHKLIWMPDNNPKKTVAGLNRSSGLHWHMNSHQAKWEFIPKLGQFESNLRNFEYQSPYVIGGINPDPTLKPKLLYTNDYDNLAGKESGVEKTFKFDTEETIQHTTTLGFKQTASLTLNYKATVSVNAEVPGMGGASTSVEKGMELTGSLERNSSCTTTKTKKVALSFELKVPGGGKGVLTVMYYEGNFDIPFTCECAMKGKTKIAPREFRSTADPEMEYAFDAMLEAALKGAGFKKPDSQVTYSGDTAKFQLSGQMQGEGGFHVKSQVIPDKGTPSVELVEN